MGKGRSTQHRDAVDRRQSKDFPERSVLWRCRAIPRRHSAADPPRLRTGADRQGPVLHDPAEIAQPISAPVARNSSRISLHEDPQQRSSPRPTGELSCPARPRLLCASSRHAHSWWTNCSGPDPERRGDPADHHRETIGSVLRSSSRRKRAQPQVATPCLPPTHRESDPVRNCCRAAVPPLTQQRR